MAQTIKKERLDNLKPTQERVMDTTSYFLMQVANGVAIAIFTVGAGFAGALNLLQVFIAIIIGIAISAFLRSTNGRAGLRFGIPFTVQLRSSFGFGGAKLAGLIRVVPALVLYGFQTWIGAAAINMILKVWIGFDNVAVCFVAFQIVHILATRSGFQGIKWLENVGAIFIMVSLAYMFYEVVNKYGLEVTETVVNLKGSWGLPFISACVVVAGNGFPMTANMSDIARNFKKDTSGWKTFIIYFLGLGPITIFMALIGLMSTGATGSADPIQIFVEVFDNKILLVFTLLFVVFSQLTTNVLSNSLPVVYVFMDLFKMKFNTSVIIAGVLPVVFFPWKLVTPESAGGLNLFIRLMSAFLGPLITIMLMDFYVLRKEKLNIDNLYNPEGPYKGVNPAAVIAVLAGAAIGLSVVKLTWLVSFIPTALIFYILTKKMPSAQRFTASTEGYTSSLVDEKV